MFNIHVWSLTSVSFGEVVGKASVAGDADVRLVRGNGTCRWPKVNIFTRLKSLCCVRRTDARVTSNCFVKTGFELEEYRVIQKGV